MSVNESIEHIVDQEWEGKSLGEIVRASPAALQGITDERAAKIAESLGAKSIRELATNKYVLWAQALATLAEYEK